MLVMVAAKNSSNPEPQSPGLAVVVPVNNEVENVGPLAAEISAALSGQESFEMIFVDDGSNDGTADQLRTLQGRHPELRVFSHRQCFGQSAAIWTGVAAARALVIATLDGDGQNDPADIPGLLERFRQADAPDKLMVVGHRAKRRDTWLKRTSSRIANGVRAALLGDGTPDTGCGLKVFSRDTFLAMPRFDHMHRFLPALMMRGGGRVESVPVNHRPRERGQSKYGLWNRLGVGITDLFGVMWLLRRGSRPEIEPGPENDA